MNTHATTGYSGSQSARKRSVQSSAEKPQARTDSFEKVTVISSRKNCWGAVAERICKIAALVGVSLIIVSAVAYIVAQAVPLNPLIGGVVASITPYIGPTLLLMVTGTVSCAGVVLYNQLAHLNAINKKELQNL